MGLEDKIRGFVRDNKGFLAAAGVYLAGSAADYLATYYGLQQGLITEMNPVLRESIEHLGAAWGLLLPKALFSGVVLLGSYVAKGEKILGRLTFRPEPLLYAAGIGTALAGASWLYM
ncbi:hypothetical protein D6764_02325 [Candidatus Woesearchaeota archaeon]|nr:MAG: hypothetical protein D6764_02325 [Candidatus Woesearchaeota archaeon]